MELKIYERGASVTMTVLDFDKQATEENFKDYFPQEFKDLIIKNKDSKNYKEIFVWGRSKPYPVGDPIKDNVCMDGFTYCIEW